MQSLQTVYINCPYCGERFDIVCDCSIEEQSYIEDCFVCCRPIQLQITAIAGEEVRVIARHENEC